MWHDNETEIDLLGFEQFVDTLVYLIQNSNLLPLTIGVFGDWGSGKSSLMAMARTQFAADKKYLCVSFSPWQHEHYDDVKAALMAAVITALRGHRSLLKRADEVAVVQAQRLWAKCAKRIDWFRLFGFAAKGVATSALVLHGAAVHSDMGASMLNDLGRILPPEELKDAVKGDGVEVELGGAERGDETVEQSVSEFRDDFAALLDQLDINALVVFVDDLDRCLPSHIVATLEAIRLFLAVPKTAFVIGADERIIQHAVATRYPELPGQAVNVGRDYLEKIVQMPIRIPPMNDAETETYLNLLGCQIYAAEGYGDLVAAASEIRRVSALDVAMNYGIARTYLGNVPADLEAHMRLVGNIGPMLGRGLQGNPRQTKRFMNTLVLRQGLAHRRGMALDNAVLAKLMILEYFHEAQFRQIFEWRAGGGVAALLGLLEAAAMDGDAAARVPDEAHAWLSDQSLRTWLLLDPPLGGVNLDPYFYFSRDRVLTPSMPTRRLSQRLQETLAKLLSESDAERANGKKAAAGLSIDDLRPVYEDLLGRFRRDPGILDSKLGALLVELATDRHELVPALAQALQTTPPGGIQPALAMRVRGMAGRLAALPAELRAVLEAWACQDSAPRLAKAAKGALDRDAR